MWAVRAGFSLPARTRNKRAEATQPRLGPPFPLEGYMEKTMIKLVAAAAVALAVATSAQAMSPLPLHQETGMITQVREACGAGMHMVNGVCITTSARRHVRRGVVTGH